MQAVKSGHHIGVLHFASLIGEREEGLCGESHYLGCIIKILFFAFGKAVDDILYGTIHLVFVLGCCPAQHEAVLGLYHLQVLDLLGCLLVHEGILGLQ